MNKMHGIKVNTEVNSGISVILAFTNLNCSVLGERTKCSHWLSANGTVNRPTKAHVLGSKTLGFNNNSQRHLHASNIKQRIPSIHTKYYGIKIHVVS